MIDWIIKTITIGLVVSGAIFGVVNIIWGKKVKPECKEAREEIKTKGDRTASASKAQLAELMSIAKSLVGLEKRLDESKGHTKEILGSFKELILSKIDAQSKDIAEIKKAVNGKPKQSKE